MNTRQKGNAFQDWIQAWLLENIKGISVHNQKTVSSLVKYFDKKTHQEKEVWVSKRNDIFGCIDLIAIPPNGKPIFIQATLHTGTGKKLRDLLNVNWNLEYVTVQLWQKREDGTIIIKNLLLNELREVGKIIRRKYYKLEEGHASEQKDSN